MNLWTFDSERNGLCDSMTRYHCFVFKLYRKPLFHIFADMSRWDERIPNLIESNYKGYEFHWKSINDVIDFIKEHGGDAFACHNMAGFDLPAMEKHLGGSFSVSDRDSQTPDTLCGIECNLIDTLVLSRALNPDRELPPGCPESIFNPVTGKSQKVGPHSFMAWGYRVAKAKPEINDWENDSLYNYINRCVEDVGIGERVFDCLKVEAQDTAMGGDWKEPLRCSKRAFFAFCEQERTGVVFDVEKAVKLVERIDREMLEIEEEVNRFFLEKGEVRLLPPSQQPNYPKATIKKDGTLNAHAINWCKKFGIPDADMFDTIMSINRILADGGEIPNEYLLTEPITINNQDAIKKYLVREGWKPTLWRMKNLFVDKDTKKQYPDYIIDKNIAGYIEDVKNSEYKAFLFRELEWEGKDDDVTLSSERFRKHVKSNGRNVPTTPQIKDQFGKICENLEAMDGEFAKKIVKWLSLRNRRNVIKSEKGTGWLNDERLKVDGRISAGQSGTANTHRWKHRVVRMG